MENFFIKFVLMKQFRYRELRNEWIWCHKNCFSFSFLILYNFFHLLFCLVSRSLSNISKSFILMYFLINVISFSLLFSPFSLFLFLFLFHYSLSSFNIHCITPYCSHLVINTFVVSHLFTHSIFLSLNKQISYAIKHELER